MWSRLYKLMAGLAASLIVAGCAAPPLPTALPGPTASPAPLAQPTPDARPPQTLRLALAPFAGPLDPHINCTPELNLLVNSVYETLIYLDDDYFLKPSLAQSWEASPDGMSYTFKLYPGAYFHDGAHFDAAAARQNFDRVAALAPGMLPGYLGTDQVGDYTIRVRFARPYGDFLNAVSGACLAMLSPASFGEDTGSEARFLAGTGPFAFAGAHSLPGDSLVLVLNQDYQWGPALWRQLGARYWGGSGYDASGSCRRTHLAFEHIGPAFLDKVTLQFMPDPTQRAAALESGAVDVALDLTPADATRLDRTGHYWVNTAPLPPAQLAKDRAAARLERIDKRRLTAEQVLTALQAPDVLFNASRREVNCLSYGAWGWDTTLYETSIREMP